MRHPRSLWIVTIDAPSACVEALSEILGDGAAAVTVLAPPRQPTATVEAVFDREPDAAALASQLAVFALLNGVELPTPGIRAAPDLDWLKKVAEDFPPVRIGRWTVHGALHRGRVPNRLNALQIDATSAFGTGEHPTTRGCLLLLDGLLKSGFYPRRMADIGCGSGILAMACVQGARGKGGKARAVGVELDVDSVLVARGNIRANGFSGRIQACHGRGYAPPLVKSVASYDLIMANIFARPLCQMAYDLKTHLRPGGYALLSGLLTSQAKSVIAAHRMQGLALVRHWQSGEWSALALHRPDRAQ